ncbi:cupin domain-containing protein [Minwuia sp.]|uniref:cupin domain-containing protein n=1 Tax=Minwuia sp. TaxID=2493630 RepID=UPI003A90E588
MTTALTPNADNHAGLGPMASRFVGVDGLPWEKTAFAGVETKTLLFEKASGLLTALMRLAPGAELPDHAHMQIEQTFVLEGHLVCGEGECRAGDFVWRPAGGRHRAWSPEGGIMLGIFMVPNKFFSKDGETDLLGQDWNEVWKSCGNMR